MEAIPAGSHAPLQNPDGPSEPDILQEGPKAQPLTGMLAHRTTGVQLQPHPQTRGSDEVSRHSLHLSEHVDGKEDNKDIILLDPKLFVGAVGLITLDEDILSRVRAKVGLLEDSVTKGLGTSSPEWEKDGDLVYREGRICVPKDETL